MNNSDIGRRLNVNRYTVMKYRERQQGGAASPAPSPAPVQPSPTPAFEVAPLPDSLPSADELLERREREFDRRDAHERAAKLVRVKVNLPGPIGIVHFGDPHVDDPGCDIRQLRRHVEIVKATEGMFGANIGDASNNWVGRLAQLHGNQSTTAREAWVLVEWMVRAVRWLYLIGGNHDMWSGDRDPIPFMAKQAGVLYKPHGVRLALGFPNGREVRINARHDFKGHSMWNPTHGPMKAAQMGPRDHVVIAGHTHTSGIGAIKDPATGTISHCLRVGAYKVHDDYAQAGGFPDGNFGPAVCTIIDPDATDERALVKVDWDIPGAADYLTFLRKRRKR
jgi:hypothetical protein